MKDKLVKFNHKAVYYRARKITFVGLIFVCAAVVIALPISIILANETTVKANKEKEDENDSENTPNEIELLRYQNESIIH